MYWKRGGKQNTLRTEAGVSNRYYFRGWRSFRRGAVSTDSKPRGQTLVCKFAFAAFGILSDRRSLLARAVCMPATEVDELKAMFASPPRPNSPPRESALPLTRIAKFAVADENSRLATQGRIEREERLRQREELQQQRLSKAQANRDAILATNARAKLHQDLTREKNQNLVRSIRATEAEWQVEREQAHEGFREEARKRVLIANALDARLDAQEAAVDQEERKQGTMMRIEVKRQVEEVRQQMLMENQHVAALSKAQTEAAVLDAAKQVAIRKKLAGQVTRQDSIAWKAERDQINGLYAIRADVGKSAAQTTRELKNKNMDEMYREKKRSVTRDKKERAIDFAVAEEKAKQLQAKRDFVERKYRSQFAAQDEAEKWNTVPLRRFFG